MRRTTKSSYKGTADMARRSESDGARFPLCVSGTRRRTPLWAGVEYMYIGSVRPDSSANEVDI